MKLKHYFRVEKNTWFKKPVESFEVAFNDSTTSIMAEYFKLWSAYTKHIIVIEPHPTFDFNPATFIAKQLSQKQSLRNAFITRDVSQNSEFLSQKCEGVRVASSPIFGDPARAYQNEVSWVLV